MALSYSYAFPGIPSSFCTVCVFHFKKSNNGFYKETNVYKGFTGVTIPSTFGGMRHVFGDLIGMHSRWTDDYLNTRDSTWDWRLNVAGIESKIGSLAHIPALHHDKGLSCSSTLEIPVTCYQLIGVPDQSEKDEIVKSAMELRNAEIEEGYSMDVVVSRQDLLMDVRDKLLFEPHYAGNIKENIPPKCSIRIPWVWLPGALCLLQEVGQVKLVLDIGQTAVQCSIAKPYMHDILLSMVLAECAIAKIGFEKKKVSKGFEALARAQYLLRSRSSLGKLKLLTQIEESLEELAPACTLELLGMPSLPMHTERRVGAIAALRELLRQGLDVESSCQVQDWPCFLSQALATLMAAEMVDVLPWDDLALIRKNKKSIESQHQRVVIDFNCFYMALKAHVALGFSMRKTDMIEKAKTICECLMASEGVDLKLEEAFCLFLLGQYSVGEVFEKLQQSNMNSKPALATRTSSLEMEKSNTQNAYQSLEIWLRDAVLGGFSDTKDCSMTLVSFLHGEKKNDAKKKTTQPQQTMISTTNRAISSSFVSDMKDVEDSFSNLNSSKNLGNIIRQLTPTDMQSWLRIGNSRSDANSSSVQLKRDFGINKWRISELWLAKGNLIKNMKVLVVVGCIGFTSLKLTSIKINELRPSTWIPHKACPKTSSLVSHMDFPADKCSVPVDMKGNIIAGLRRLSSMLMSQGRDMLDIGIQGPHNAASVPFSTSPTYQKPMSIDEAEALVKHWQMIKAEALGPNYQVYRLSEILDETMLFQWQALADAAKAKSCYWKFVLLQMSVLRAELSPDKFGSQTAEIEVHLEEAAELVNEAEPMNPSYYSNYKVRYVLKRQQDGSWRLCEGDILEPI